MAKLIYVVTMFAALSLAPSAQAHYVWLERDGEGPARAYFGEWIADIREKTGGLLDRIKAPRVLLGASTRAAAAETERKQLRVPGQRTR